MGVPKDLSPTPYLVWPRRSPGGTCAAARTAGTPPACSARSTSRACRCRCGSVPECRLEFPPGLEQREGGTRSRLPPPHPRCPPSQPSALRQLISRRLADRLSMGHTQHWPESRSRTGSPATPHSPARPPQSRSSPAVLLLPEVPLLPTVPLLPSPAPPCSPAPPRSAAPPQSPALLRSPALPSNFAPPRSPAPRSTSMRTTLPRTTSSTLTWAQFSHRLPRGAVKRLW